MTLLMPAHPATWLTWQAAWGGTIVSADGAGR
jgi:hypothetical protein